MAGSFETRLGTSPEEGIKAPVVATTTEENTLTGEQTVNGVQVLDGDRVLVRIQTNQKENGIYYVRVSAWERTPDFNEARDTVNGVLVLDASNGKLYQTLLTQEWNPGVVPVVFNEIMEFSGVPVSDTYIPTTGTVSELPVTGIIEFKDGDLSWLQLQGNLFGVNAMLFNANSVNSGFYVTTKDAVGDGKTFSFTPDGQLFIPSYSVGNNEVWVFEGKNFLSDDNTLSIYSFDQDTNLRTENPIQFFMSDTHGISFGIDGTATITGLVTAGSPVNTLTTRQYVDDSIAGSGNLPPDAAGNLLVGTGAGWIVATGITLDVVTTPGQADLSLFGKLVIASTDPAHQFEDWNFTTGDIFGANQLSLKPSDATGAFSIFTDAALTQQFAFAAGFLSLPLDPTSDTHAATKKYVDDRLPAGGTANDLMRWDGTNWIATSAVTIDGAGEMVANQSLAVLGNFALGNAGPPGKMLRLDDFGIVNGTTYDFDEVVLTSGAQTIAGAKTFSDHVQVDNSIDAAAFSSPDFTTLGGIVNIGSLGELVNTTTQISDLVKITGAQTIAGIKDCSSRWDFNAGLDCNGTLDVNGLAQISGDLSVGTASAPTGTAVARFSNTIQCESYPSDGGSNINGNIAGALSLNSSDSRLKHNIEDSGYGLNEIMQLRSVKFRWNSSDVADVGFIAQETKDIIPEAVPTNPDGYYGFNESPIISALVKGMQEQQSIIQDLQSRLEAAGL